MSVRHASDPLPPLSIVGLPGFPEIREGDDLAALALAGAERLGLALEEGDVLVFTQKAVSKAEGRLVHLDGVAPSALAVRWAERWERDARVIELALSEAQRIVRMDRGVLITETHHGYVCANSGVDTSNVPEGQAALLPLDPDASARRLCEALRDAARVGVGVVVSDTFGRPWREGQTDVALGVAGLAPIRDYRGSVDAHGRPLRSTRTAVADELAGAAELVMGKTLGVPVALVRGTGLGTGAATEDGGRSLIRPREEDLFP